METMLWTDPRTWIGTKGLLLHLLENVHIGSDHNHVDCRFPCAICGTPTKKEYPDYRGYAGRVAGGVFKAGDEVMVLPSGFTSKN